MKFTFLVPNIEISGGNRANFELANALVAGGHEVAVVYPTVPGRDGLGWLNLRKTAVQVVKGLRNLVQDLSWFPLKARLSRLPMFNAKALSQHLPHADYLVFSWWAHGEMVNQLSDHCGQPIHLVRSMEFWGGPEALVAAAYRLPIPKVVTSDHLRQQLVAEFDAPLGVVPDSVDLSLFHPPTEKHSALTIGMMYRTQPLKRMADGIDALIKVQTAMPEVKVHLFGESIKGPDRKHLQALRYDYSHFPTGTELRDIYQSLDIFLFPSGSEEAFGLPPLEAMACGCAVVATRVGAVENYSVDEVSARHCEVGDVDGLAAAMLKLTDESVRSSWGAAAVQAAGAMDWSHSANALLELLPTAVKA